MANKPICRGMELDRDTLRPMILIIRLLFPVFILGNIDVLYAYVPISDEQLFENTSLMAAAEKIDISEVNRRLRSGNDPNELSSSGGTALMVAARSGNKDIVKALLDAGANPANCGKYGYCPIWYAVDTDSLDVLKMLVNAGADPKWVPVGNGTEYPPLQLAVKHGNIEMVKYLVNAAADIEFTMFWSNYAAPTPLAVAVAEGYLEITKYLLSHGALIHEATEVAFTWNTSALEYARDKGHHDVVEYIETLIDSNELNPEFTVEMFIDKLYKDPGYQLYEAPYRVVHFLERVTMEGLRLMRNSIFARKGYKFKDQELASYFRGRFSDYKGNSKDVSVTDIDKENIEFLKSLETMVYNRSIAS